MDCSTMFLSPDIDQEWFARIPACLLKLIFLSILVLRIFVFICKK